LSVAVVDDDKVSYSKSGKAKRTPRSAEEIARMTTLVKEAVGFDEKRGDTVNVTNASFSAPPPAAPVEAPPIWKQEWVWDVAKQVGGGLMGLLILLLVVRPLLRGLQARPAAPGAGAMTDDRLSLGAPGGAAAQLGTPGGYDQQIGAARSAAQQDPKKVAQVVKGWVANDS
jgi:flagellar M-ring protein FliF